MTNNSDLQFMTARELVAATTAARFPTLDAAIEATVRDLVEMASAPGPRHEGTDRSARRRRLPGIIRQRCRRTAGAARGEEVMPVFDVDTDERYPTFGLKQVDKPAGAEKEAAGQGWIMRVRVALTEAEFADWCRVNDEYDAWTDRIDEMKRVALLAAK